MKNLSVFPLERNNYFYGKLLTVRDFQVEQTYFNNKRRILNSLTWGPGVLCGMGVSKGDDMTLIVESGLALDYAGREIIIEAPIIRKLQMIDGYESLYGKSEAYLSIRYAETMSDPVNAVGAESGKSRDFNRVEENFMLTLEAEQPDIPVILDTGGKTVSALLYCANGITAVLSFPVCTVAGEECTVTCTLIKSQNILPASIRIKFHSDYLTMPSGSKDIELDFTQNAAEHKPLAVKRFMLRSAALPNMRGRIATGPVVTSVENGDLQDAASVIMESEMYFALNEEQVFQYQDQQDTLLSRMQGGDMPIYLARLEIISAGSALMISGISPMPFAQRSGRGDMSGARRLDLQTLPVTTHVYALKQWQKPEADVRFSQATQGLEFHFGLPGQENYDYTSASGTVDIPLTGGMKVNGRYFSDEIPHHLGIGNVEITLAIEQQADDGQQTFFGNCEVFHAKGAERAPQIATAAALFPERGTFRVGIWLLDSIEGTSVRVRYFAKKIMRDLNELKAANHVQIQVLPEIQRVRVREQLHLKAMVTGTEDRGVIWSVVDHDGGSIDKNGLYRAPDVKGTYEVVVQSVAEPDCKISTFIIVED